ncbi:hypothetical protein Sjap_013727 [Stephania japonica]|uniref:Carbonic anhydrase n=1 Tax=Stephania japonica TaxID=461633 RepID=A0AAP0IZM9_9MAGN
MDNWAWDTAGGDVDSCGLAWPPVADQCGNWGRHTSYLFAPFTKLGRPYIHKSQSTLLAPFPPSPRATPRLQRSPRSTTTTVDLATTTIASSKLYREDQKEFDYISGSEKGPERWGELHKEWADCNKGDLQSPIDLLNKRVEVVTELGQLKRSYKPCNATLKNRGHDIMLQWDGDAGSIEINGEEFELRQLHWHSPSEHTINGNRFDLEAHLVHVSADNRTAVIGVMYDIGRSDPLLSELEEKIRTSLAGDKTIENVGVIDPRHVRIVGRKYYKYLGSLTTPPCREGVIWIINRKIMTVSREQVTASREQVTALREAVHDHAEKNARPLQPINHREIRLFSPKHRKLDRDIPRLLVIPSLANVLGLMASALVDYALAHQLGSTSWDLTQMTSKCPAILERFSYEGVWDYFGFIMAGLSTPVMADRRRPSDSPTGRR